MQIKTSIANLENYKIYQAVEQAAHEYFQKKGYLKVDVPVLSPALIPESYLEVFETEFNYIDKKEKLYLTPSPEIFLKRLIVEGIGNCYYLGKAFRNSEPNSSWHLPEFTMLEFYKMGIGYLEMAGEVLKMLQYIEKKISSNIKIQISNQVQNPKCKKISFKKWEKMTVSQAFEKYAKIDNVTLFNHKRFYQAAEQKKYQVRGFSYEDIFTQIFAQELEPHLGSHGYPTLLYDYPKELASLAKMNLNGLTAQRCEFYIHGLEIGGFCTELNDYKEQEKRFKLESLKRKKNKLIDHTIDKGFIKALQYGLGTCTGAGIGFERLAMIFTDVDSIDKLKLINYED